MTTFALVMCLIFNGHATRCDDVKAGYPTLQACLTAKAYLDTGVRFDFAPLSCVERDEVQS